MLPGPPSSRLPPNSGEPIEFKWLDFKITNRCNRSCTYCGVPHDPPNAAELLGARTIQRTLEDALALGFTHFALLGGEPSIRDAVESLLEPFRGQIMAKSVMVITNGVMFNEPLYRALYDTSAEVATLVFSFDSFRRPNYKSQDPQRCLEHIRTIQVIAEEYDGSGGRRSVSVHTVISRENLRDVEEHVEFFQRRGIDVSLALVCPARFLDSGTPACYNEFTYDEIRMITSQLEALDSRGHLNFANRTLLEYLHRFPFNRLGLSPSCLAGRQVVIINPDGEVYPCVTTSYGMGVSFGNINQESLAEIYPRMHAFRCTIKESQACWDHFLWNRLAGELAEDRVSRDCPDEGTEGMQRHG